MLHIIPDSCLLLDYMLHLMIRIYKNLVVHEDNMRANLERTLGLVFSQRVMLRLIDKGMSKTQLIKAAKISTNAMAKLGKNEDVRVETLVKICGALGCTMDDIMELIQDAQ